MELGNPSAIENNEDNVKVRPSPIADSAASSEAVYRGTKKEENELADENSHANCHLCVCATIGTVRI